MKVTHVKRPNITSSGTPQIEWSEIQEAVNTRNRKKIEALGKKFNKPRIQQEGVRADEVAEQILAMAPGHHPMVGPCLLDLAEKIK